MNIDSGRWCVRKFVAVANLVVLKGAFPNIYKSQTTEKTNRQFFFKWDLLVFVKYLNVTVITVGLKNSIRHRNSFFFI